MPHTDKRMANESQRSSYHRLKQDPDWLEQKRKAVRESHARAYATPEGRKKALEMGAKWRAEQIAKIGKDAWDAQKNALERKRLSDPKKRAALRAYAKAYQAKYRKTEKHRIWFEKTKRDRFARLLRLKYGMTLDQYEAMALAQSNKCAICNADASTQKNGRLAVDHCHSHGHVRALLCDKCNLSLGGFNDSPELLDRAAAYLRTHVRV